MEYTEDFACVFNCMDGRCQRQVNEWVREQFGVTHVDTITEPGIDALLAGGARPTFLGWLEQKAAISAQKHGAKTAVVVGHLECAGNPVGREEHKEHIRRACERVRGWNLFAQVRGALVNEEWEVEEV